MKFTKLLLTVSIIGSLFSIGSVNAESTCSTKDMLPLGLGDCKIATSYEEGTLGNITIGAMNGAITTITDLIPEHNTDIDKAIASKAPDSNTTAYSVGKSFGTAITLGGGGKMFTTALREEMAIMEAKRLKDIAKIKAKAKKDKAELEAKNKELADKIQSQQVDSNYVANELNTVKQKVDNVEKYIIKVDEKVDHLDKTKVNK